MMMAVEALYTATDIPDGIDNKKSYRFFTVLMAGLNFCSLVPR